MAKNFRRMFAMVMVLCMVLSALPMQALAEETTHDGLNITITPSEGSGSSGGSESGGSGGGESGGSGGGESGGSGGGESGGSSGGESGGESGGSSGGESSSSVSKVEVSGTSESTKADVSMEGTREVTTETTQDSSGNTTTNTKTEVSLEGTVTEDNIVKDATWQETTQESSTTNSKGEEIKSSTVIDGESTKKWDVPEDDGTTEPDVTVSLIPGQTTTAEGIVEGTLDSETTTKEDGTVVTDTTYEADRTVTATTSKFEVTVNDSNTGLIKDDEKVVLTGPAPVYDYINDEKQDKVGMFDNQFNNWRGNAYSNPENWDMPEDADLRFLGTGEHTMYYSDQVYVVYEKDQDGNTIYDENNKPVIKELWRYKPGTNVSINQQIILDGKPATELPDDIWGHTEYENSRGPGSNRPTLHAMMDQNGNVVYGYCIDNNAPTTDGDWYKVINLEDSDYYASEDAENHVRNILMNGYWGTSNIAKKDGSYEEGSVERIKEKILEAAKAGKLDSEVKVYEYGTDGKHVYDEKGNPKYVTKSIEEVIAGLTAGEAMIATQAAIWSFSNGSIAAQNGKDGVITIDPDSMANHKSGNSKGAGDILDDMGGARLDILYTWLISLEDKQESTVIINDKNFVEDMSLTVMDKVPTDEVDAEDTEHDLYNTELNFKLSFTPGENDELYIELTNGDKENPEIILDAEGNPIKKKLVNAKNYENATEDEKKAMLCANDEGVYTLTGLQLHENTDFTFDLRLEGTQYLEHGVYVYEGLAGREVSQNFVGVAQGAHKVDVSAGMTISFDVDETNKTVVKREWHYDDDPSNDPPATPPTPPTPPEYPVTPMNYVEEDVPAPQIFRLNNQNEELVEIPEEPVPLATPAVTGDNSGLWVAVILIALCGIVAVNVFDKKRQHESF